jgi:hypothetical protein
MFSARLHAPTDPQPSSPAAPVTTAAALEATASTLTGSPREQVERRPCASRRDAPFRRRQDTHTHGADWFKLKLSTGRTTFFSRWFRPL